MIRGLLALHGATGNGTFVNQAVELERAARERFFDDDGGGYFDVLPEQSDLFVRLKSTRDGVVPAGVSVMIHSQMPQRIESGVINLEPTKGENRSQG